MSKPAIYTALALIGVYMIAQVVADYTDALYDDRSTFRQLAWWLANTLVLPVFAFIVLGVSTAKRLLTRRH